jgi:5-methylcytosine-specific restriction endonuclease McrA
MKTLQIETVRETALLRDPTTVEDIVEILKVADALGERILGFAWSAIAHRALMSLLPSFDNLHTYNDRRRAVERMLKERGLEFSPSEIEGLIELGGRLQEFRAGATKSSWSDLHYTTRREILVRQNHRCVACGVGLNIGESGSENSPELDHILPFAMRGNIESNTRIICKRCNLAKQDHLTYITQGRLAFGDNFQKRDVNMNRLLYWAVELAANKCENKSCSNTSTDSQLHIVRRSSQLPWSIDNVRVHCSDCSADATRFPHQA